MLPQAKYLVTAIALFASDISAAPTVPAPGDDYPVFMVGKKGLEGRKSTPTATCQYAVWIGSGYWIGSFFSSFLASLRKSRAEGKTGCLGKPADTTKVCPKDHPKDQGSGELLSALLSIILSDERSFRLYAV